MRVIGVFYEIIELYFDFQYLIPSNAFVLHLIFFSLENNIIIQ